MEENLLHQKGLYQKQLVQYKISIPFESITTNNLEELFIEYAENNIMNQCEKQGYIASHGCKIISYSCGNIISSKIHYDVLYEFMICLPYEDMTFKCKIQTITKIGIRGVLTHDENKNPFVVFASYLHNSNIQQTENQTFDEKTNTYKEGDVILIRVIGHRFEINDPSIYVLAEIINKSN